MSAGSKVVTMREAIASHVHDGDTVVIEGFTHLICFAAAHEIIRHRRRDLTPDSFRTIPARIRGRAHL